MPAKRSMKRNGRLSELAFDIWSELTSSSSVSNGNRGWYGTGRDGCTATSKDVEQGGDRWWSR
jgi:hypothetical protein